MSELANELKEAYKDKEFAHASVQEFLNIYIATQIKVLREQRGWTQKELADKVGMKQSRISVLENVNYSRWSIATLEKLAEAFDVAIDFSFEGFTKKIYDIDNFSRESLMRARREDDLKLILDDWPTYTEGFYSGVNLFSSGVVFTPLTYLYGNSPFVCGFPIQGVTSATVIAVSQNSPKTENKPKFRMVDEEIRRQGVPNIPEGLAVAS